ncbi:hypothetical protein HZS61_013225 [Fusarium oxysporum f. sp. conglutinans]|uniref:HTH CENPB-type domain-containing protein n=1 Tax=Fusarium oxysporum f. sp. conglutinans TaxID=100902 RepID=A0A8H6GWL8_FUSOX|nr:hypothetical protein HZS61_013225 [Fusarium oxysporum f. sp. conglutinans]KAG6983775.1 hypothetical protein FocnCong_v006305 [Fusarium oxysporum f. sp. conglutinans]
MLLALQALQNNRKLSIRRAATIYEADYHTLHRRQHGIQSRCDSIPNSWKLSDLEEQIIVQFVIDLDSQGFPSRLRFVEEIANSLLADRDASPVGKRWALNFVKRQPELKMRLFRKYDYQRAKCEDPSIIRGWFRLLQNTIAKYGIRSDDIGNFDVTGFMMGVIMAGMVVTGSERRGRPKSVQPGNREWITVIQAINAEGQSTAPFIIGACPVPTLYPLTLACTGADIKLDQDKPAYPRPHTSHIIDRPALESILEPTMSKQPTLHRPTHSRPDSTELLSTEFHQV